MYKFSLHNFLLSSEANAVGSALRHRLVPDPGAGPGDTAQIGKLTGRPSLGTCKSSSATQLQVPVQVARRYLALKKGEKKASSCIGCRARLGLPRRRSCNQMQTRAQWLDALKRGGEALIKSLRGLAFSCWSRITGDYMGADHVFMTGARSIK